MGCQPDRRCPKCVHALIISIKNSSVFTYK
jgi:hypothetical protein